MNVYRVIDKLPDTILCEAESQTTVENKITAEINRFLYRDRHMFPVFSSIYRHKTKNFQYVTFIISKTRVSIIRTMGYMQVVEAHSQEGWRNAGVCWKNEGWRKDEGCSIQNKCLVPVDTPFISFDLQQQITYLAHIKGDSLAGVSLAPRLEIPRCPLIQTFVRVFSKGA